MKFVMLSVTEATSTRARQPTSLLRRQAEREQAVHAEECRRRVLHGAIVFVAVTSATYRPEVQAPASVRPSQLTWVSPYRGLHLRQCPRRTTPDVVLILAPPSRRA